MLAGAGRAGAFHVKMTLMDCRTLDLKAAFFFFVPVHKECNLRMNVNCVAVRLNTFCAFSTLFKGQAEPTLKEFQEKYKKKKKHFFTQSDFFVLPFFFLSTVF